MLGAGPRRYDNRELLGPQLLYERTPRLQHWGAARLKLVESREVDWCSPLDNEARVRENLLCRGEGEEPEVGAVEDRVRDVAPLASGEQWPDERRPQSLPRVDEVVEDVVKGDAGVLGPRRDVIETSPGYDMFVPGRGLGSGLLVQLDPCYLELCPHLGGPAGTPPSGAGVGHTRGRNSHEIGHFALRHIEVHVGVVPSAAPTRFHRLGACSALRHRSRPRFSHRTSTGNA